jgi:hypothetical protein
MASVDFGKAMKNPGKAFAAPEAVEAAQDLSTSQKHAVLTQWRNQLEQLMVATEENMPGPESASGANADCLRRIVDALIRMGSREA